MDSLNLANCSGICLIHGSYYGTVCPGCAMTPTPSAISGTWDEGTLQRIAIALERIAGTLERNER